MKKFPKALVLPLLVLVAAIAATVAAGVFTGEQTQTAQRKLAAQRTQMREAQTRVQKSGSEKEMITRYLPDYKKLGALGFVGDEQRINWLDALRNANQKVEMFGINYDISAQQPYPHAAAFAPGQMNMMQSVMKLRFQMLHEEDLPLFLQYLSEQNAGVFVVNQCSVRRAATTQTTRYQPNMLAECQLAWITAQPAAPLEIRP